MPEETDLKKYIAETDVKSVNAYVFFWEFQILYLVFNHFEFVFGYSVRKYSGLILLHLAVQFFQHHLLKKLSSLRGIFLPPLL